MINAGFVDFLFTGAAIVPEALFFAGYVGEAMLLMIPMLIAACLISLYRDHVMVDEPVEKVDPAMHDHKPGPA